MTIDINELRRLAQAATPGPWINHGRQPNVAGFPHSAVGAKTLLARVYSEAYGDVAQETANADLIAAANPAAVSELLDRLEAAERERDALRAKVEQMERQEPVAKVRVHQTGGNAGLAWSVAPLNDFDSLPLMRDGDRLYALPGAKGEEK